LHFGDHDPSGMDMSRDLSERFTTFINGSVGNGDMGGRAFTSGSAALNMPQIEELNPRPQPGEAIRCALFSSTSRNWRRLLGADALPPEYLDKLVRDNCQGELGSSSVG